MKPPRSARVPRAGREARPGREPRTPRAPRNAPTASADAPPAPGSRWHQVRSSGSGVVQNELGVPQVFELLAVVPFAKSTGEPLVEYRRIDESAPTRMNLAAFRARFIPAP